EAVIAEATFDADGLMGIYCSDCNALLDTCVIPKLVVSLSDDATLLTLLVDGVSVSGFDPLMLSYSIAVPYSVTSVAIVATANDVGAMVSGDGVKVDLVVGANTFDIIVTAEDGSIQVYTLTVTRDIESGPVVTVVSATPTASVKQLSGNQNDLTITVTELLSDGTTNVISQIFRINNNAVDTYTVGPYRVYVDTKGNTQIRACYIVNVEDIDEPVNEPVNVVLSIQLDASGFYLVKQSLTVEANLSERYGYTDAYNGTKVTTLDALVAAHILMFGDENLAYYLDVDSYGTVWMIAGKNAEYSYFFVNGALPDSYTVVDVVLTSGDDLMFYFLQDTYYWSDAMAWFVDYTNDNVSVNSITVEQGEIFDVTLVGYMALWAFYGDVADYTEPIEGAQVVVLDFDDSAGFCSAWFGEELGLTDASGQLSITFNTPGTYILSAYDNSGYDMPFVAPWLVVTVTEKTVLPVDPVVVRTVEELYDALNNPDVTDIIIPSDGIIELTDSVTINSGVTLTIQGMLNLGEMGMISNVGTICNVGGIINNYAGGIIYNSADGVISISDAGTINNYQATINNDGVINNDDGIINNNDAAINNAGGGIITNGDMGLVNNYGGGVINNYDSSVIISSGVVNNYQATINNSEFATFSNDGGLVNNNAAEIINNGGVINNSGIVNNYGAGLVNNCAGGVINNFGAASVINNYQAVINNNEATINNDDGAMFNNNEATILNNAGTIINDGAGMVNNYGAGEILNRNGGIIDNCRAIINNGAVIDNRGGGVLNNDADGAVYTNELGVIYNDDEGQ
ncbi:MAG: cadherin-like beta sandwich domain-containing protein, partial [Candidatus Bathyarchaeota archaeon]|nr:cadherin-like beta sandwich domain-containing protein [Candidatus Termiticorpusculum sp.]